MKIYEDWMKRAKSAYLYAITLTDEDVYYKDKCYQAQQATEKAIKGLLIYYGLEPEYTHDIGKLLKVLRKHTYIPDNIMKTKHLTQYAIVTRYPGAHYVVTEEMFAEAIEIAKNCL